MGRFNWGGHYHIPTTDFIQEAIYWLGLHVIYFSTVHTSHVSGLRFLVILRSVNNMRARSLFAVGEKELSQKATIKNQRRRSHNNILSQPVGNKLYAHKV